jgi:superfamily II DNA/RNA helicase
MFNQLNLEPSLYSNIQKIGFDKCTPIQSLAIPKISAGLDIAGLAQTGTGKTGAFLIPMIDRILKSKRGQLTEDEQKHAFVDWQNRNFILILVPTRELAEQVQQNAEGLLYETGLCACSIYGGTGYEKQIEAVKSGAEFVVATPGRLIDLYKEHHIDLKQVRAVVFDEADRMFDMGFKDDMKYILSRIPRTRQFLVFSATLNFDVLNTAYQFGAEPIEIDISRDQAKAENVKDEIFHVGHFDKPMMLLSLIKNQNPNQVIIFSNYKHSVDRIAQFLTSNGLPAMGISSLLSQNQRNRVIEQFKAVNNKNILVATDVAARGLDIKGVDMVINFDLPGDSESYVHRIGRTGRAGAEGKALSLVSDQDVDALSRIESYLKHKIEIGWMDDTHLIKEFVPYPSEQRPKKDFGNREFGRKPHDGNRDRNRQPRGGGDRKPYQDGRPKSFDNRNQAGPAKSAEGRPQNPNHQRPNDKRPHENRSHDHKKGEKQFGDKNRTHNNSSKKPFRQNDRSAQGKPINGQAPNRHRNQNNKSRPNLNQNRNVKPPQGTGIISKIGKFFKGLFQDS